MHKTTALFIVVGIMALLHVNLGGALPLNNEGSHNLVDRFQGENNWKRVERSAKDAEESEEDEDNSAEDHSIEKRRNPFKQNSGNAEENANQLFSKAYKIHNLNGEADNSNSELNNEEEDANHNNANEVSNKDEQEKSDGVITEVTHNNIFGEKPINPIEKASDDNNVDNSNLAADKESGDSGVSEKFDRAANEDEVKMHSFENHHSKRCGIHKPKEKMPCEEKMSKPCDYEELEKFKQNSTKIAMQAAKAAKLASDSQKMAAEHAARIVKTQLSEQAQQASQKAQAVLAGKESYVAEIECQIHEAEELYKDMRMSLEHIRRNVESAQSSRQDACEQVEALQIAVKVARKNIADAEAVVEGTEEVAEERETLLRSAKRRLQTLLNQLKAARCDYRNTKMLAQKAAMSAAEARACASRNRRKLDFNKD